MRPRSTKLRSSVSVYDVPMPIPDAISAVLDGPLASRYFSTAFCAVVISSLTLFTALRRFFADRYERERKRRAVWAEGHIVVGLVVSHPGPVAEYLVHAAASSLANLHHREHAYHGLVARIGTAGLARLLDGHAEVAWVRDGDGLVAPHAHRATPVEPVGVGERVHDGLAQRLVGWCVVHAVQAEGHLERRLELVVHAEVEVVHVAGPVAGLAGEAILPARVVACLLPIVQKIMRELVCDPTVLAEHEESGARGSELSTDLPLDVVDRRHEREGPSTMTLTSNTPASGWDESFDGDDTLPCALDRVFGKASVLTMRGPSCRGRELGTFSVGAVSQATRQRGMQPQAVKTCRQDGCRCLGGQRRPRGRLSQGHFIHQWLD